HDNFFELGGHSLLAVRLLERLRGEGLQLEIRALFDTPVLRELANTVQGGREVTVPPVGIKEGAAVITPQMLSLIELEQEDIDRIVKQVPGGVIKIRDIYALSPLQDGMLFHHLLSKEGDPYLLSVQMSFPERDLLERFLEALQQVIGRHDILRTGFYWEGLSRPAQVVLRRAKLSVEEVELEAGVESAAQQLSRRFDTR